ncbi:MAG: YfhO family protein [Bryobacterales bacterium]|nr:YfhO family protein [Bryobacterales bacterium]
MGLLLLAVIGTGFYWKLTLLRDQFIWFDHPDMAYLEIPRLQFQASEIHQGRFPLWDPHIWSGQPLIGQTQPGPLFPGNLLLYLLPLRDGYLRFGWLNLYWVAIHIVAAWLLYLWARDLGLSQPAAILGGVTFGFGGFIGTVAWLDVVNGIIWAPGVLMFTFRAARGPRLYGNAAAGGILLGISWLSGHHEMPILLSTTVLVTWVWLATRDRRLIGPALVFLCIGAMVASAQVLPTFEFGRLSRRWVGLEETVGWNDKIPYRVHILYSLPARGLLGTVLPHLGRFADSSPYVGWIGASFAFLGVVACWKERVVRWGLSLAAIATVYSLGSFAPLNGIIYSVVPVLDKARIPSRGMALLGLAICVLAVYGWEHVLRDPSSAWLRKLIQFLVATGTLVLLATIGYSFADKPLDERIALGGLACLACSALLSAWKQGTISRNAFSAGLLIIVLIELTSGGPSLYPSRFDENAWPFARKLAAHNDVASFLRQELTANGPFRVAVNDEEVGINFGDWHGIDTLHGYVAGATENIVAHELHTARTQDLLGVRYWLGTKADRPDGIQQEVFTGTSGIKVYRNPTPFPRAWIAHETKVVPDRAWMRVTVQDATVDLRSTAVLIADAPQLERCGSPGQAAIVSRSSDRIILSSDTECAGMLVVSETNYPGWEATVDGQHVRMWEPYGALRGVVVPAGKHRVEMRFRPRSVYAGLALCTAGMLLAAGIWIRRK